MGAEAVVLPLGPVAPNPPRRPPVAVGLIVGLMGLEGMMGLVGLTGVAGAVTDVEGAAAVGRVGVTRVGAGFRAARALVGLRVGIFLASVKMVFVGLRVKEGAPVGRFVCPGALGARCWKMDFVGAFVGPVGATNLGKGVGAAWGARGRGEGLGTTTAWEGAGAGFTGETAVGFVAGAGLGLVLGSG